MPRRPALALAAGLALLVLVGSPSVHAHDESVSASDVQISDARVRWTVDVGVAGLAKALGLSATGREMGPGERALSEPELEARRSAIVAYVTGGLTVTIDGQVITAQPGALTPKYETLPAATGPALTRVALELVYPSPSGQIGAVTAKVAFFSQLTASHRAVLRISWGEQWTQSTALGVTELSWRKGELTPSRARVLGEFVLWGVHHILIGLDHIAFLLALVLAAMRVRELLLVVTSFTIAHSITILLSALEVVRVPPALTEALIAASIVYVAAENLIMAGRPVRGRWVLTFGFGLVHGLGFAEVLRERLAEVAGGLVLPVIAFNVGVELGQVALILVAFPALVWLRRTRAQVTPSAPGVSRVETRQKQIVRVGSVPIMLAGLYWLVERLS